MQEVAQDGFLFGNGSEIYVTRNQLNELSQKVRTQLDIEEIHETHEFAFDDALINKLILMAPLQQVNIDEALSKLSKLGIQMDGRDLSPNEIKREMSNRLVLKTENGKKYIVSATSTDAEGSASEATNAGGQGNAKIDLLILEADLDAGVKYAEAHSAGWKESNKDENQQLRELNQANKKGIQWQIEGTRIVPKSIHVAKITRATLSRDFVINWSKTRITDAKYKRKFGVRARNTTVVSQTEASQNETCRSLEQKVREQQRKIDRCEQNSRAPQTCPTPSCPVQQNCTAATSPIMQNIITSSESRRQRSIYAGTENGRVLISTDNGQTWLTKRPYGCSTPAIYSICKTRNKLFVATANGLFVSNDTGQSWKVLDAFSFATITGVQCGRLKIFLTRSNNVLYTSANEGATWRIINGIKCDSLFVSDSRVYSFYGSTLYKSLDNGRTWINTIINTPGHTIPVGQKPMHVLSDNIYVGIDNGLHISYDNGITWSYVRQFSALHNDGFTVNSVVVGNRIIYVGTQGGFYKSSPYGFRWNGPINCTQDSEDWDVSLLVFSGNSLYLGTDKGIFVFEERGPLTGKCRQIWYRDSCNNDRVTSIVVEE